MPDACDLPPRKGSLIGLVTMGQLALALLMPLPRINISFPKKGGEDQDVGPDEGGEGVKLVDVSGRKIIMFHGHHLIPQVSIALPKVEKEVEEAEDVAAPSDQALIEKMIQDGQEEGAPEGGEPAASAPAPPNPDGELSLEDAIKKALNEEQEAEALDVAKSIVNADGTRDVALPRGGRRPRGGAALQRRGV